MLPGVVTSTEQAADHISGKTPISKRGIHSAADSELEKTYVSQGHGAVTSC